MTTTKTDALRRYTRDECVVFRITKEKFGGLSNMSGGFPLRVNGILVPSAEALYQSCRFPHRVEIQKLIIDQHSPMTAKMVSKPYRGETRQDWMQIRVRVMRWVLRVKLAMHWTKFGGLLLDTGDRPIVEDSKRDDFWGALRQENGTLVGMNVLGRLLMELREELKGPNTDALRVVAPPPISTFLLLNHPIEPVGFEVKAAGRTIDPDSVAKPGTLWSSQLEWAHTASDDTAPEETSTARTDENAGEQKDTGPMMPYPKRLIEVDLPIKRISVHARREKSIRHGHISTLHIWWARRPLAACRAVICAALWPDPADPLCPVAFRNKAREAMLAWTSHERQELLSEESRQRFEAARRKPDLFKDTVQLRGALLDFIADFANWDNSTIKEFLETSRALTQAAHEALGGAPGTRPLVVDPFAGGGSIPLEALRVGADAFASDLNPIPVLLNKVILEYIPKYGQRLADEVRKWGEWIQREAEKELAEFYPKDADGATPIAYLWARVVKCEGPRCGAEIPLLRSLLLAKKRSRSAILEIISDSKAKVINFKVSEGDGKGTTGTIRKGSTTCPICDFTTPNVRVRAQLTERNGGAADARLIAVVTNKASEVGRFYRTPTKADISAANHAREELKRREKEHTGAISLVPNERIPTERPSPNARGLSAVTRMGVQTFGELFTPRQALTLSTFARLIGEVRTKLAAKHTDGLGEAVQTILAFGLDRLVDRNSTLCRWDPTPTASGIINTFSRQALSIMWDFAEGTPFENKSGGWIPALEWTALVVERESQLAAHPGQIEQATATSHPLPNDAAQAFVTDPPYYDAIPYADLSDFFYVWMRRSLPHFTNGLLHSSTTPKDEEAIWNPGRIYTPTGKPKDTAFYESQMAKALEEGRRVTAPSGIGVVVFAHKSTAGWEAILSALINAGWIATASWPVDTEMGSRMNAMGTASLASSVHIVCRPRENPDGSVRKDEIGDWRDVLAELPKRIHEWMPRLAQEGVVGADAIFACIGPALEIFSRHSRVEKASGEPVKLKEYLEHVWAAVAKEALTVIFAGADATGFEEDARLTAMWLWTLLAGANGNGEVDEEVETEEAEESEGKPAKVSGYFLEYDTARKIAQGLGAHLENLASVVEVIGEKARLLPVAERTRHLFGKDEAAAPTKRKRKDDQLALKGLVEEVEEQAGSWGEKNVPALGNTVLDRVHQSMILFAAGRGEALKRFLVEEGVGRDQRFWKLAQAFAALYPAKSDERRWVEGVLARKKGLGF